MKNYWRSALVICTVVLSSHGDEVLNVSYDAWNVLQLNGAIIHPNAAMTTDPIECFDMGTNGSVEIPNIALPQGPLSIESRYYLRSYNETDPNLSDILAAWNMDIGTEGVGFRVGGGYNYSLKIQDVYHNVSDWIRPGESEKAARAAISKAIGTFFFGSGMGAWKEIYTDRCIETNKWVHMAATWDGTIMRIYLNGHNATDSWRTVGSALPAFIASVRTVMIGACNVAAYRHYNGKIGYVRVYNEAFSPCQVWHKYRESLGSDRCVDFIKIESPRCGEVISRDTKIKFAIKDSMDNDVTPPGQAFTVNICREPTFSDTVSSYPTVATECTFGDLVGGDEGDFDGLIYFRISACNTTGLRKTADSNLVAESGTLPAYLLATTTKVFRNTNPPALRKGVASIQQLTNEVVYDLRGRKVGVGAKSVSSPLKSGIYFIKAANGTGQKILNMK